jgi:hypothetical protein
MRPANGRARLSRRPNIRAGSGSRMVSTVAPLARSAATVRATDWPVRIGSNPARSVSLMPTTTLAMSGSSSSAAGT